MKQCVTGIPRCSRDAATNSLRSFHVEAVGDFLICRLAEWASNVSYGHPGDGIDGIMGVLNRTGIGRENN